MNSMNFETEAIRNAIMETVPERADEIGQLWERYSPQCSLQEDRPGFYIEGGPFGLILFTNRTWLHIWLLGIAAQKALFSYSGVFWLSRLLQTSITYSEFADLPGQQEADKEFDDILDAFCEISRVQRLEDYEWPSSIPRPLIERPSGVHEQMAFDLVWMATAWVFLHEVQHIRFIDDNNRPRDPIEEELACDRFATDFILEKVGNYANQECQDVGSVTSKRAMAIGLASLLPLAVSQLDNLNESGSHPAAGVRIAALLARIELCDEDWLWGYLASAKISILRYKGFKFPTTKLYSEKQAVEELLKEL